MKITESEKISINKNELGYLIEAEFANIIDQFPYAQDVTKTAFYFYYEKFRQVKHIVSDAAYRNFVSVFKEYRSNRLLIM